MNARLTLHHRAATAVQQALATRGHQVQCRAYYSAKHVIADGRFVAVRAAVRRIRAITIRHPKRAYDYAYAGWLWGLHVHGKRREQPAYWALVAYDARRRYCFTLVLPASAIGRTRLTVHLQDTNRGRGPLRQYRNAWHLIPHEDAPHAGAA